MVYIKGHNLTHTCKTNTKEAWCETRNELKRENYEDIKIKLMPIITNKLIVELSQNMKIF